MSSALDVTNGALLEALDYLEQLFKDQIPQVDGRSLEERLVGTMSYLAATAFTAGKTPADLVGKRGFWSKTALGVEEQTIDGTCVTHLNKDKLNAAIGHVLKIDSVSLSNIADMDEKRSLVPKMNPNAGTSDPFVVFTKGISMSRTEVLDDKTRASISSTHYLFIRNETIVKEENDELKVYVFDRDVRLNRVPPYLKKQISLQEASEKSDLIGVATIDMATLNKSGPQELSFKVKNEAGHLTTVDLRYEFLSVDEYCQQQGRTGEPHWFDKLTVENDDLNWRGVFQKSKLPSVNLSPLIYFDNVGTSTEGWIHSYEEQKVLVVGFKGTNPRQLRDIRTDLEGELVALDGMNGRNYILDPSEALLQRDNTVHHGFRDAYVSVRATMLETLYTICRWHEDWLVVLTGHSLGGALAVLAAYEVANRKVQGKGPKVAMMNFGCPRLASDVFVKNYTKAVPVSYRFRAPKDIIPCYPGQHKHVNNLVKGHGDGTLTVMIPESQTPLVETVDEDAEDTKTKQDEFFLHKAFDAAHFHEQQNYFDTLAGAGTILFK